jgi:hypothetical protein
MGDSAKFYAKSNNIKIIQISARSTFPNLRVIHAYGTPWGVQLNLGTRVTPPYVYIAGHHKSGGRR